MRISACSLGDGILLEFSLSIASCVGAGAEKLLWRVLTSLQSFSGAVRWFTFSMVSLHRESWCSSIFLVMVSFRAVMRSWLSSDGSCDRRCLRCRIRDLISGVNMGVKFRMWPAGMCRLLALVIASLNFAVAASMVLKSAMLKF